MRMKMLILASVAAAGLSTGAFALDSSVNYHEFGMDLQEPGAIGLAVISPDEIGLILMASAEHRADDFGIWLQDEFVLRIDRPVLPDGGIADLVADMKSPPVMHLPDLADFDPRYDVRLDMAQMAVIDCGLASIRHALLGGKASGVAFGDV